MDYFDFHTHPNLKTLFRGGLPFDLVIPANAVSGIPGWCTDLPRIVASQSSVRQYEVFGKAIVCVALYAVEKIIAEDRFLQRTAESNRRLNRYINPQKLKDLASLALKPFSGFVAKTLEGFENSPAIKILRSATELDNIGTDHIHVFFTVEGSHSLCDSSNVNFTAPEAIQNLDVLLQRVPVISINITHMQQSALCNHAYGAQLVNVAPFIPRGNGLAQDGIQMVQALFDRNICVDIKHMSLFARRQLMERLDNNSFNNPQPLICTHTGFTGLSVAGLPGYMIRRDRQGDIVQMVLAKPTHLDVNFGHRPAPAFNASSINLFDEEIAYIVKSKGLIGISLDRRICGYVDKFDSDPIDVFDGETFVVDREYIPVAEFGALGLGNGSHGAKVTEAHCLLFNDLLELDDFAIERVEFNYLQVMLHLKHYLQVCISNGISLQDASRCICIGSDFDGVINPLFCAESVKDMPELKDYLGDHFFDFLGNYSDSRQWRAQLDISGFLGRLFFQNGFDFLKTRFMKLNQA